MKLNATLETRTSKDGKDYKCVVIKISDKSEKLVFLTSSELELLEMNQKNNTDSEFPDWEK